jgi:hypothetical protein
MTTILVERQGETWAVALTPEMSVGGFSSEQAAGHWLIEYLTAHMGIAADTAAKSRILVAAMLEPRSTQ